jgi:diaminohydroxyphosphoribosylaminopyrimidine deaminase/5-amino-6-(5-phosphoribosylamino)uracil reductase
MDTRDSKYMRRALELAQESLGLASPNPPVGCVIVQGDTIVGEGFHVYPARDHAEIRALAAAGDRARGASAYLTLEPCVHQGRTPPCTSALIDAGVGRIVVAHADPNPIVSGRGISQIRSAGIEVRSGLLQAEAARIIEPFACHVTTGLPLVVGKVGMSLDGKIAPAGGRTGWITSEQGRNFGQQLRLQLDAIMVGIGTVLADDPQLTYRGELQKARPLRVIVLDSFLRTPPDSRLLHAVPEPRVLIFCAPDAPAGRRQELESRGVEIVPVMRSEHGLDLLQVLRELGAREILGLLVEGGSEIHWSFLSSALVDKFFFIVSPLVLGGRGAVPAVGGTGYNSITAAPRFRIAGVTHAGPDTILEAYPANSKSILSPWLANSTS